MAKVLILFAHPRLDRSVANAALAEAAEGIEGVTFIDLYAKYPDGEIDVDREQNRLVENDVIIFQHPLYWYSSPAMLKEWQDLVLEYGFAYGTGGDALTGKVFFNATTCGGGREAYSKDGIHGVEIPELLVPFRRSFLLCHMRVLAPFVCFAAGRGATGGDLAGHARKYRYLLEALVDERVDFDQAETVALLSEALDTVISAP